MQTDLARLTKQRRQQARKQEAPPISQKGVNSSEEFLGQRDDDARRASHIAEPVLVSV
jgi:hypothetical protein